MDLEQRTPQNTAIIHDATYENTATIDKFRAIQRLSPKYAMLQSTIATAVGAGKAIASASAQK